MLNLMLLLLLSSLLLVVNEMLLSFAQRWENKTREVIQGLQGTYSSSFLRKSCIPNFCHLYPENRFLSQSVADPGEGPWAPGARPPLCLDQTETWWAENIFLRPEPPYLKVWIRHCAAIPLRRFWRISHPEWRSHPGSREYPSRPW